MLGMGGQRGTAAGIVTAACFMATMAGCSAFSLGAGGRVMLRGRPGVCGAAGGRLLRVRGGCPGAPSMQFGGGGLFGFGKKEEDKEEAGKFVRQGKLEGVGQQAFGPLGLVVGGFGDDELEVLAEAVERVLSGPDGAPPPVVPIAVLGQEDFEKGVTLSKVLSELSARDSVLPDAAAQLKIPLVMFSGFMPIQVSGLIKSIVGSGIRGGMPGMEVPPMCAIAVPKAMDKTFAQLCEEIEGDHMANAPGAKQP